MDRAESLHQAIEQGKNVRDFREALASFETKRIRSAGVARQVIAAIEWAEGSGLIDNGEAVARLWEPLVNLLEQFDSRDAFAILREAGIAPLSRFVELNIGHQDEAVSAAAMTALRMLGRSGARDGAEMIVKWMRSDARHDGYEWSLVLDGVAQGERQGDFVCQQLRDPLPTGFKAIALLDMANQLAFDGKLRTHPFDTEAGTQRLEQYLTDSDRNRATYAVSAVRALPFLSSNKRESLLALAFEHSSRAANLEAAWASARLGSEAGVKVLSRLTCDVHASRVASAYLEELGRADAIPADAGDADFQAMAEMSNWLQHPNEFGREPDELELWDVRELFWPPTNDVRMLRLVRYAYKADEPDEPDDEGIGIVGPVTFALFGELPGQSPPLDAYALYCCWELELNADPRAPQKRSIEAGADLLTRMNPQLDPARQIPG